MEDFNQMCADIDEGIAKAQEKQFATGKYVGTGDKYQDITLGFRPSMLFIRSTEQGITPDKNSIMTDGTRFSLCTDILNNGFRLHANSSTSNIQVNKEGITYMYVAFK